MDGVVLNKLLEVHDQHPLTDPQMARITRNVRFPRILLGFCFAQNANSGRG